MGEPTACPECATGKHGNCDGTAWDNKSDRRCDCACALLDHDPVT